MRPQVLIVDDEKNIIISLKLALHGEFDVDAAQNGTECLEKIRSKEYSLVLLDLFIGDDDGMEILKSIKEISPDTEVIMVTAFGSIRSSVDAIKYGAYNYVTKPVDLAELKILMRQALQFQEMNRSSGEHRPDQEEQQEDFGIRGSSSEIRFIRKMISRLKDVDTTVIITGESGTGKELVARALHYYGKRSGGQYVEVNCAAIPEGLLESEFFGYKKGAFTGAVRDKKGKFELADGGTLFLDEVGEMPLGMQSKLLRVLQERAIIPVGGAVPVNVDVRVVAATNRNLLEMVKHGEFREDLYYRLHVMELNMSPLRERQEDIGILCRHYLSEHAARNHTTELSLSPEAQKILMNYPYPGNVRQLFNFLEYAVLMADEGEITPDCLPRDVVTNSAIPDCGQSRKDLLAELVADMPLDLLAKEAILATLEKNGMHKKLTAQKLGISERNLRYKLEQYRKEKE